MATNCPVTLDTLIVVKLQFQGNTRKFKIPLRDLGANVLPEKLRALLEVPASKDVVFERYSDSSGSYVTLDSTKPQVYKTLFRAAKAKLKLRLRASIPGEDVEPAPSMPAPVPASSAPTSLHRTSAETLCPAPAAQVSPVIARTPAAYIAPYVQDEASPVSPVAATNVADAEVKGEAPVPRPFTARQSFCSLAPASRHPELAIRPKMAPTSWVVYCNNCNLPMENDHYHCSICDHGDYDLCPSCVDSGIHCPGSNHWMVKRFVKNGCVVNSTTERVAPKEVVPPQAEKEMPGAFTEEKQSVEPVVEPLKAEQPTRTCNCCVQVLPEQEFVTCTSCDDYDLCLQCHISNKHGHHPAHAFTPATSQTTMPALADFLCNAGRNVRHSAVCDGCDKFIYGVRHKCLNCPDWDFCSECVKDSKLIHPGHRFVPIYEPLAEPVNGGNRHYGIYCDGPLCKDKENQSYIEGTRYKCAVCHDKDFCANCEAHPSNRHNHTHPLIKFKRPVRSVSVTTMNEDRNGNVITKVGDREPARKSTSTETVPAAPSSNAATQVHTIVDVKPTEESQPKTTKEKIEIRDLLSEPVQEKMAIQGLLSTPAIPAEPVAVSKADSTSSAELDAHFVRDTIPDGTAIIAGRPFVQVWTLRNPGPNAWPAGCSVRSVGGDNMLNVDNTQPLSQSELADASESNVIGREVAPNEEIPFRVVMKAPVREGTAISYWRLKKADGTPFGHRLWCDIKVVAAPAPAPAQPKESASNYERFQQAKMERYRALRAAQAKAQEIAKAKADAEHKAKVDGAAQMQSHAAEHAKMLRIQQVRKAAVERLLETRRKEHEAYTALQQAVSEQEKPSEVAAKEQTVELPVEEKIAEKNVALEDYQTQLMLLEQQNKERKQHEDYQMQLMLLEQQNKQRILLARQQEQEATSAPQQSSGMIFPQLDKESPASSTHEAMAKSICTPAPVEAPSSPKAESVASEDEFFEDAESVDIRSLGSDDGFLTDEEYDILDASDEEML